MERCPSGLRCRPGTSVWGQTPPRVRIPPFPNFNPPNQRWVLLCINLNQQCISGNLVKRVSLYLK